MSETAIAQLCIALNLQGITKPREVRKFEGEGMPLYKSTKKGDLYITFHVVFPEGLTDDQKAKLTGIFT